MSRILGVCLSVWLVVGCGQPDGTPPASPPPGPGAKPPAKTLSVAAGTGHSLALRDDGTVWA
ncbi:RCC1 domain-containing protein [Stigmatella erecta]|uniref:Regulator of chromosome condensation (RCC1) repeat-containing protein n=1 Tax=Stigmatella erecta TaxID=83460 RepID=A0A1I0B2U5_9BACT|nr:Regulator of chromosome condensation (RCC1) repeat-containing protein [Stigmatella erecta]